MDCWGLYGQQVNSGSWNLDKMSNLVTFLFCFLESIISNITSLFSILKGSRLHLGAKGSRRERKLRSYIFFFHLTDILDLLAHCWKKRNRGFMFDNVGQRESVCLINELASQSIFLRVLTLDDLRRNMFYQKADLIFEHPIINTILGYNSTRLEHWVCIYTILNAHQVIQW